MALAIDVAEYIKKFDNGRGIPALSPIPPGLDGYDADFILAERKRYETIVREAGMTVE